VEPVGSTAELEDAKTAARTRLDAVKRDVGEALGL
jgi:phosphomannomutase